MLWLNYNTIIVKNQEESTDFLKYVTFNKRNKMNKTGVGQNI